MSLIQAQLCYVHSHVTRTHSTASYILFLSFLKLSLIFVDLKSIGLNLKHHDTKLAALDCRAPNTT